MGVLETTAIKTGQTIKIVKANVSAWSPVEGGTAVLLLGGTVLVTTSYEDFDAWMTT